MSGLLTLIPVSLFVGPIAGYAAGSWLVKEFGLPPWVLATCTVLGFLGGAIETIRVIKAAIGYSKES